ncbi:unnamed protein product [Rotaria magnacalcarata]|uniref:Uncharacterized protein n=1 Tax=Rotaria magnacalcarata TaxID=392030 RepID=A0A816AWZ6_9BILA|nr:unnamed protein product [Rotaria magnacalcarata]CAF1601174.1 unnamed protein product [Rotaria magnacalcarata]CAF1909409.1 unnamed protein product [Rotaria magnacalcarata]CAF3939003.1 unnamed protein product [Rotaria magnacalcarata]CAF3948650.1 unnamed protein product [Rotaria magnacalcarata]
MCDYSTDNCLLHTTDYKSRFDTVSYLQNFYSGVDINPSEAPLASFFLEKTVQILHDERNRFGNQKVLEFGGGPNLSASLLLAQYADSIRFCDYTQSNLNYVTDWIEQKSTVFDWTNYFESVLTIAGTSKEKRIEWESRLRDALSRGGLSICDVNDPGCPILSGKSDDYDIIFSSFCLEAACLTIDIFNETIGKLVRLLKPGGLLLLVMVRNESFYYVGAEKFFCLSLDEAKVKKALQATGELVDIHIDSVDTRVEDQERNTMSDFDGEMIIHAFKTIE